MRKKKGEDWGKGRINGRGKEKKRRPLKEACVPDRRCLGSIRSGGFFTLMAMTHEKPSWGKGKGGRKKLVQMWLCFRVIGKITVSDAETRERYICQRATRIQQPKKKG